MKENATYLSCKIKKYLYTSNIEWNKIYFDIPQETENNYQIIYLNIELNTGQKKNVDGQVPIKEFTAGLLCVLTVCIYNKYILFPTEEKVENKFREHFSWY